MSKHYKNETGTSLRLDTGILVGSATEYYIKFHKPSGATGSWSATLFDSYSNLAGLINTYYLQHSFAQADLSESGVWEFQAYIAAADGTWYGETVKEMIYDAFE